MRLAPRTPPWLPLTLALAAAWAPSRALAAGGGGDDGTTLTVVLLLAGVAGAYLLAHFVVDELQTRFLVLPGVEYLLLGLLLTLLIPSNVLDVGQLLPMIALAAGWIGLLRGMGLDRATRRGWAPHTVRIALLHHGVPGALVGVGFYFFVESGWADYFFGLTLDGLGPRETAAAAFMLGCCAAADSVEPFDILARRYRIEGPLTELLRGASRLGDLFVLIVFGLVFCIWHPWTSGALQLTPTEWGALQFGLGVLLGLLFTPFLGGSESSNKRFLALVGIITFASGAAFFLELSSLSVNVVLGIVLVNVARTGREIRDTVANTGKPMHLLLLMFAGALWQPPPLVPTVAVLGGFLVLRVLGKALASRIGAWGIPELRKDLYRAFLAHGEVSVAMAVSFQVVFDGPVVDLAYTVVLGSIVLHDLLAPRFLRGLLVDAGDIHRERNPGRTSIIPEAP
ncbi:MAG: hypothetical protein KF901_14150 [Myxococcales bacterium]|nr:hypothetical protein [Myxococcales bacterium]